MGGEGGPGTNPWQLFAVGYAAGFQSALQGVAQGHGLDAADSTVTARVVISSRSHHGVGLVVALDLHTPRLARAEAEELMVWAHERCLYSHAIRGNVDVTLTIDGTSLE
jgi:Ohr subfamily peroxiredoxin